MIAFAIVLASALAWFIARASADPIGRAAQAARHMAAGDMRDALHVLLSDLPYELSMVDIDQDPALLALYDELVPV